VERIARVLHRLAGQDVARGNAADAAADLRQRLREQEDVDDYLEQLSSR